MDFKFIEHSLENNDTMLLLSDKFNYTNKIMSVANNLIMKSCTIKIFKW